MSAPGGLLTHNMSSIVEAMESSHTNVQTSAGHMSGGHDQLHLPEIMKNHLMQDMEQKKLEAILSLSDMDSEMLGTLRQGLDIDIDAVASHMGAFRSVQQGELQDFNTVNPEGIELGNATGLPKGTNLPEKEGLGIAEASMAH